MEFHCSFGRGKFPRHAFRDVRSPRWTTSSAWIELDDAIVNRMPDEVRGDELQMGGERAGESYISLMLKEPLTGPAEIRTTCSFDDRMAPLIVLSPTLEDVHGEHLELVLYDRGLNLWYHYLDKNQRPAWHLLSCLDLELKPHTRYQLTARTIFNRRGVFLNGECEGHNFACRLTMPWPERYFAGITACEGRNRFYDFTVRTGIDLRSAMAERFTD